ncbi:MAG: hypothetical protein J1E31_03980 [Helicobacter sp.]|nr:hypothetical protein [Helicobacter sp.]
MRILINKNVFSGCKTLNISLEEGKYIVHIPMEKEGVKLELNTLTKATQEQIIEMLDEINQDLLVKGYADLNAHIKKVEKKIKS